MSETLLALLPVYGLPALGLVVGLGCLGVPLPSALAILVSGAFVGSGDFPLVATVVVAFLSAVAGDNLGYLLGRFGGARLLRGREKLAARTNAMIEKRGTLAIVLSHSVLSPLGPVSNLLAGAARMSWPRFLAADVAGEVIWVGGYLTLGYVFSGWLSEIADLATDITGFLAAAVVAGILGWMLVNSAGKRRRRG